MRFFVPLSSVLVPPPAADAHDRPAADADPKPSRPGPIAATSDGPPSRMTALVRLVVAVWLIWSAVQVLSDPPAAQLARGADLDSLVPLAGSSFALGIFLLTGFMSRLAGLLLAVVAVWDVVLAGASPLTYLLALVGVYFMLRGGGAWGMDVYVNHMQERVRRREAAKAAAAVEGDR